MILTTYQSSRKLEFETPNKEVEISFGSVVVLSYSSLMVLSITMKKDIVGRLTSCQTFLLDYGLRFMVA